MSMFVPHIDSERIRSSNRVVRPPSDSATTSTGASVFALWILVPLAIGALAYVLVGIWTARSEFTADVSFDTRIWMGLTLLLQTGYWMLIARSVGVSTLRGLWALVPLIALIPTFGLARAAARGKG